MTSSHPSHHPLAKGTPAFLGEDGRQDASGGGGLSYKVLLGLAPVIDATGVLAVAGFVFLIYSSRRADIFQLDLTAAAIYAVLIVVAFEVAGLYDFGALKTPASEAPWVLLAAVAAFAMMLAFGYAMKVTDEFSRVWGVSTVAATCGFVILRRVLFYHLVRGWAARGRISRRLAVVGSGEQAQRFLDNLNTDHEPWLQVVGLFEDRPSFNETTVGGYPVLGSIDNLVRMVRNHHVDEVVVTVPWHDEERIGAIVSKLIELPVGIHLGADLAGYLFGGSDFVHMGDVPLLKVQHKPLDGWGGVLKSMEDRLLGFLLIMAFSPVMLLIGIAIKLESDGPVLFRQPRYGFNNRVFEIYKFRTMYHGHVGAPGVPQATKDDPRVTRVGRILRRASLDELPQLFNVLQGTMSLVGPRPHAIDHNEHYAKIIQGYFARHRVKPGITGWAQVNGLRGETDTPQKMAARVRHDVFYIENWSLMFDLRILVRTFFVGFIHPNAY